MSNSQFQIPRSAFRMRITNCGLRNEKNNQVNSAFQTPHSAMESGITAVPLIIALVLMISLGAFFISLMLGKHIGAPLLAQATKALFVADAGIEYTAEYLKGYVDWTTVPDISSTTFGSGTFAIAFTNKAQNSVTAASTGTIGNTVRDVSINFVRKSLLELNPVTYISAYNPQGTPGPTINCEGGTQCDPAAPLDNPPYTCLCTYQASTQEAPAPTPPTGVTWTDFSISGDYTFPTGTYYFNNLTIGNGDHVTFSGSVTIWIQATFDMGNGSTFNFLSPYDIDDYGDPANVLILSAANGTQFWLRQSNKFSGAIYAPNGTIDMKNSDQLIGAFIGDTIWIRNFAAVTFDPSAGNLAGGYIQTVAIVGTGWGEI